MTVTGKQKLVIGYVYALVVLVVNVALAAAQFADHFSWDAVRIMVAINPIANLALGVVGAIGVVWLADKASRTLCLVVVALLTIMMVGTQFFIPYVLWTLWKSFAK